VDTNWTQTGGGKVEESRQVIEKMVSAEGIESALKTQRKNLAEHSWQSSAL